MAIATVNGVAWASIATLNGVAKASVQTLNGKSAGSSTPTAPSISQHNGAANNTTTATTLSNVVTGDLILVWASNYEWNNTGTPTSVAMSDSASNTYTAHQTTPLNIGEAGNSYMTCNAWTAVANGNAATLTITVTTGDYRGVIAVNMGQVYDAGIHDDGGTRKYATNFSDTQALLVDNATTTYSHDYVIAGVCWYESDHEPVQVSDWAVIRTVGDVNNNRLSIIGKQVTATGNYDPQMNFTVGNTHYAALGYVIKGEAV